MTKRHWLKFLFLTILMFGSRIALFAQAADPIERVWLNEEKTAKIQVYKATDGKYYGRIIWLKEPLRDGKPKIDIHNPKSEHRNDPIMGLLILKGFKKNGTDGYDDGTIYDPKNGKTYSCKITNKGDKLDVRGYVGFSMFGRTTVWTKAD